MDGPTTSEKCFSGQYNDAAGMRSNMRTYSEGLGVRGFRAKFVVAPTCAAQQTRTSRNLLHQVSRRVRRGDTFLNHDDTLKGFSSPFLDALEVCGRKKQEKVPVACIKLRTSDIARAITLER